jgi:hypothetical protein
VKEGSGAFLKKARKKLSLLISVAPQHRDQWRKSFFASFCSQKEDFPA